MSYDLGFGKTTIALLILFVCMEVERVAVGEDRHLCMIPSTKNENLIMLTFAKYSTLWSVDFLSSSKSLACLFPKTIDLKLKTGANFVRQKKGNKKG